MTYEEKMNQKKLKRQKTKQEKESSIPDYLRIYKFYVPSRLLKLIEDRSEAEKRMFCHCASMIYVFQLKDKESTELKDEDVEISSTVFKEICGGNEYAKIIDEMEEWKIIAVDHSFWWSKKLDGYSTALKGYCKKYRLLEKEYEAIQFPRKNMKLKDKSVILNEVCSHIKKCCLELGVDKNYIREDGIGGFVQTEWFKRIADGKIDVKHGKDKENHRVFHSVIKMPKRLRKWLIHKEGYRLCEYDVGTCFGELLLTVVAPQERTKWIEYLDSDIYERLANGIGCDRQTAKEKFVVWLSSKRLWSNETISWFKVEFPLLSETVLNWSGEETLMQTLQTLETEIMIFDVGLQCVERDIFFISEHDGMLGRWCDQEILIPMMKAAFEKRTGHCPKVKIKQMEDLDG